MDVEALEAHQGAVSVFMKLVITVALGMGAIGIAMILRSLS